MHQQYVKQLSNLVLDDAFGAFNYVGFDEDSKDFDTFCGALESYPQMADKKLIVLKDTDFLKSSAYQKAMAELLADIPPYAVVVFVEKDLAKVKKDLLRLLVQHGAAIEFKRQMPSDLRAWVNHRFAASGKKMRVEDMEYLVELCQRSLAKLSMECDKLIAAAGEEGVITRQDIDKMVTVPAEYKIFTMADNLLDKKGESAYLLLNDLKRNKEQPTVIIGLIYSQLSALLMFRQLAAEGAGGEAFLPPNRRFLAKRYESACKKHSVKKLRAAMKLCATFDEGIKTGKIDGFAALELLMGQLLVG